jgi:alkylation response protein AidB-like acyl-CoA dehydrogenase
MSVTRTLSSADRTSLTEAEELLDLDRRLDRWIDAHETELAAFRDPDADPDGRVVKARNFQRALYEGGWAQCGWPARAGGSGGSILHRAVVCDRLTARGFMTFAMFEHLEILLPTLMRFGQPEFLAVAGPDFLSGRKAWSQGFSEADAGSDLTSLRTTATALDDGFQLDGRKIWTSWSPQAEHCLVLARTGDPQAKHSGLTMLAVDLDAPGVEVMPIRQANGVAEMAEVSFDGVMLGPERLVGEVNGGWSVALDVLLHERGTFAWFRLCVLLARLNRLLKAGLSDRADPRSLGELVADFVSARAAAIDALFDAEDDSGSLAHVSVCKTQLSHVEQRLYDLVVSAFGPDITLGLLDPQLAELTQQELQFSRIAQVYGGSTQMQLNTIARQVLGL